MCWYQATAERRKIGAAAKVSMVGKLGNLRVCCRRDFVLSVAVVAILCSLNQQGPRNSCVNQGTCSTPMGWSL